MAASSELWSRERGDNFPNLTPIFSKYKSTVIEEGDSEGLLSIEGVINPLSPDAQKLTPLLVLLQEWINPNIKIILNPQLSVAELPLKNFYRFAHPVKKSITSDPVVTFSNLPPSRTLTLNLMVPEPWLVESTVAVYDMDNLVLEKIPERTVQVVYEIEALMITGHCYDGVEPPRGLQLVLGTSSIFHTVDTLVMANLGYFQLKGAPGIWKLRLAPGKSKELYRFSGENDDDLEEDSEEKEIVVRGLGGALVQKLGVTKREGKEGESLLGNGQNRDNSGEFEDEVEEDSKKKSVWGKVVNIMKGSGPQKDKSKKIKEEEINIFSIASGHLYERFTKIMILSVLRHSSRPVKFWFIKNYLSPNFKDVLPIFAKQYGFNFEFVTYKWPSWLHKQTEKQRIIWAYKILFLDVLFPQNLKKVIFVDSDQVVRADMAELYFMDLKGAPLAYTPMCDNNKEMEGYRFWKQGFWRDHLAGKPYHISALYVVDLDRFRATAAGDQLRVFYENLSKDPNSLANLDQDLPNYAQHNVPIFSLPQHWLWCESWCGNATKASAKTIDLCNNPMTKEPKLQGARRIVVEWTSLDEEQRILTERIEAGEVNLEGEKKAEVPEVNEEIQRIEAQEEAELKEEAKPGVSKSKESRDEL